MFYTTSVRSLFQKLDTIQKIWTYHENQHEQISIICEFQKFKSTGKKMCLKGTLRLVGYFARVRLVGLTPSCRKLDMKKSDFSKIYDHCNVKMIKTPFLVKIITNFNKFINIVLRYSHKTSESVLFSIFDFFKKIPKNNTFWKSTPTPLSSSGPDLKYVAFSK